MLCPHAFRSDLRPVLNLSWPVGSLWPGVRALFYQQDLLQWNQELHSSLELMDKLEHQMLEDTEPLRSSVVLQPVSYQLNKEGGHFGLTLDTRGFSPEELAGRQVGRKLRVSGNSQEEQKGSYSLQEFRQELDLPEGVNHEAVSCFLSPDGTLHILADKDPRVLHVSTLTENYKITLVD
ncbi:heat shock protein 30-like [Nematolebias whitei]|uniref:heat shock protein 30-like n=1 Tax=Nematolebias whitei TaxID=451745 RepID=UPI00189A606F|nr:heat shock protein 30-like [Nematolebias whitei]